MRKRRVGVLTTKAFGAIEPLAFLDAWKDLPDSSAPNWSHVLTDVPQALVEAKMADPANVAVYRTTMADWDAEWKHTSSSSTYTYAYICPTDSLLSYSSAIILSTHVV